MFKAATSSEPTAAASGRGLASPLRGERLAIVNDTNFGSMGRNPSLPDYSEFIEVRVPGLRG